MSHSRQVLLAATALLPAAAYADAATRQETQATRTVLAQAVDPAGGHGPDARALLGV